ncbi:hypothetical protein Taro_016611 [Colocasia esculenta]|uniref:Uncharacterized protein n=1 Tax=Colocasia esculenta TaxID=4460 RepID=A0A843UTI1_COLES|nr:hypothetical protein [Colocasia esculenta]
MEDVLAFLGAGDDDDDGWKCQKHPSAQPTAGGVCHVCLRERLLRLCPDCGGGRPCACSCPSTSSTASSSSSSLSSADIHRFGAAGGTHVGAVGRVSHLIDCEPAFRRSRSAAFRLLRPRSEEASDGSAARPPEAGGRGGKSWLWPFQRGKKTDEEDASNASAAATATLSKSRSVGALTAACANSGALESDAARGEAKPRGWNRYFPSPMKALRHQKASKTTQARYAIAERKRQSALHGSGGAGEGEVAAAWLGWRRHGFVLVPSSFTGFVRIRHRGELREEAGAIPLHLASRAQPIKKRHVDLLL